MGVELEHLVQLSGLLAPALQTGACSNLLFSTPEHVQYLLLASVVTFMCGSCLLLVYCASAIWCLERAQSLDVRVESLDLCALGLRFSRSLRLFNRLP